MSGGASRGEMPRMFALSYYDLFTYKDRLWLTLRDYLGLERAASVMPATYILSSREDLARLKVLSHCVSH